MRRFGSTAVTVSSSGMSPLNDSLRTDPTPLRSPFSPSRTRSTRIGKIAFRFSCSER
jgi:hypothetical protein